MRGRGRLLLVYALAVVTAAATAAVAEEAEEIPHDDATAALFAALEKGRDAEVAQAAAADALAAGADPDKFSFVDGGVASTPLALAAERGYASLAALLLEAGASPNAIDGRGWTPLMQAARWSALRQQAVGRATVVKHLLARGADPKAKSRDGARKTALHLTAEFGYAGPEVASLILGAEGVDVNAVDANALTPLHLAAKKGHTDIVEALLAAGANVNQADGRDYTALMHAARKGHKGCVWLLLEADTNVKLQDEAGNNAFHLADFAGHVDCAEMIKAQYAQASDPDDADNRPPIPRDASVDPRFASNNEQNFDM